MIGEEVFPEKVLLGKAATIKEFEYSSLGNELKKQIAISKTKDKKTISWIRQGVWI